MMEAETHITNSQSAKVKNYYRFHSRIYDATRWSFLFGRETIIDLIPDLPTQPRILEVGCGTGKNIEMLEYHFPDAEILGIDLSDEMLNVAQNKVTDSPDIRLQKKKYGTQPLDEEPFDLILLSYSLTMIGDQLEAVLQHLSQDLNRKGYVAVVDFHTSPFSWFRSWMGVNHVDLSGHLLPLLKKYFSPHKAETHSAYLGLWSYFFFLGTQS